MQIQNCITTNNGKYYAGMTISDAKNKNRFNKIDINKDNILSTDEIFINRNSEARASKLAGIISMGIAVAGMLFAERHRGEVVFISNVGYILSSVMCSAFIVCLLKYMLYKLLEYKDNEENKNIFLKLLEKAIS